MVNSMQVRIGNFACGAEGASLVEYSLLVALISVAILTAITAISGNMGTIWSDLASIIAYATSA